MLYGLLGGFGLGWMSFYLVYLNQASVRKRMRHSAWSTSKWDGTYTTWYSYLKRGAALFEVSLREDGRFRVSLRNNDRHGALVSEVVEGSVDTAFDYSFAKGK